MQLEMQGNLALSPLPALGLEADMDGILDGLAYFISKNITINPNFVLIFEKAYLFL